MATSTAAAPAASPAAPAAPPAVLSGPPKPILLTPLQDKLWTDTKTALLWHCPAFSHIFYTMLDNANSKHVALFTVDVPIAATDGANLLLNPNTFFKYNLQQRIFIVAHEIMHCVLNHLVQMHSFRQRGKVVPQDGKDRPYVHELMNVAMDYVINDILIESKVGEYSTDWLHDKTMGTANDSVVDVYGKIYKDAKGKGGYGKGKGFDQHLAPGTSQGKDPTQASQQRTSQTAAWQTAVAAAAAAARAQGKLPAGVARVFEQVLDPKVDWQDKIAALFARKVGSGSFDWRQIGRAHV